MYINVRANAKVQIALEFRTVCQYINNVVSSALM